MVSQMFPRLRGRGMIAIDLETCDPDLKTNGPGAHRDGSFIAGVAVGTEDGFRRYYPVSHEGGDNLDRDQVFQWLRAELSGPEPKLGANISYDLQFLKAAGIKVNGPLWDIQIAEPLLVEDRLSYSLEALSQAYLGEGKVDDELDAYLIEHFGKKNPKANIWRAPGSVVAPYAEGDVDLPLRIFPLQRKKLEDEGLWDLFVLESSLIPMLVDMRFRGIRVDLSKAEQLYDEMTVRENALATQIGGRSVWAARELAEIFDAEDIPYPRTPKTNAPSITALFLDRCEHPIAKTILEIRRLDKLRETFLKGVILDKHYKGRIHTQFHQLRSDSVGTVSGRFSSSLPNLQFIPGRTDDGKLIRSLFIPDEGEVTSSSDFCVAPETRILTTDLRHIPAGEIIAGTEVIGFDEELEETKTPGKRRRKLRRTTVEYVKRLTRPCYRIKTTHGELTCSAEHRWLIKNGATKPAIWRETENLKVGQSILRICSPWEVQTAYEDGWVAGFFDGEGSYAEDQGHLALGQNLSPQLTRFKKYLRKNNYEYKVRFVPKEQRQGGVVKSNHDAEIVTIVGGRHVAWRFLGSVRPARVLPQVAERYIEGRGIQSQKVQPGEILEITFLGDQEVIAIQTGTKTFIAEGFCSHNSQVEYRLMAHDANMLRLPGAAEVVAQYATDNAVDFHQVVAEMTGLSRTAAKTVNFGIAYGEGVAKLCASLGLSEEEGRELLETYHQRAPFMRPLSRRFSNLAASTGIITTLLGRKRRFNAWAITNRNGETKILHKHVPGAKRAFTHKALNARIQGSAADVFKKAMLDIWNSGVMDHLKLQLLVHDEIVCSVPQTPEGMEALKELTRLMENAVQLSVPLLVDTGIGANWKDAK